MKIQVISYSKKNYSGGNIVCSTLESPYALDDYDINVIDLSSEEIWCNEDRGCYLSESKNDFESIGRMIDDRKSAIVLFVIPQNCDFRHNYGSDYFSNPTYRSRTKLKNIIGSLCNNLNLIMPIEYIDNYLQFERTRTVISEVEYKSDFHFVANFFKTLTTSSKSEKITSVEIAENTYATTLHITSTIEVLMNYINNILIVTKEKAPEWVQNITILDDEEQRGIIKYNNEIIDNAKRAISQANIKLSENDRYKSILYSSGKELVAVVFDMIESLLGCDLSSFKDEFNEDFLIKQEDCTFVGEIKGVSSNVTNAHISQLDVHCQTYIDIIEEEQIEEIVKGLLVINPLRNRPINQREPIHENQIKLAERNNSLIIETVTLLNLFEKKQSGMIDADECRKLFLEKTGVLVIE